MRRIITLTLMALGLTGGAAFADNYHQSRREQPTVRDHRDAFQRGFDRGYNRGERVEYNRGERVEYNRGERGEHFRDRGARPAVRFEQHDNRSGFRWVGGEWSWNGYEWIWAPGHYVRIGGWWR